jgi:UDP-N-acetylmuramoylalanine--D-glutamate ligase
MKQATATAAARAQKALVVGLGTSGQAVCELLRRQGIEVVATDLRARSAFASTLEELEDSGCTLRLGEHRLDDFLTAAQIIVSPGVPLELEPLRRAAEQGIEIIGELEWAWRQTNLPVIAITGTNGKTTTTSLLGEIFRAAGKHTFVGGNLGTPLSRWLLDDQQAEVLILEVSSFQLDTAATFHPRAGILLNITEDHLDRYPSFAAYGDSKFSLLRRQHADELAIVNADDIECRQRLAQIPGRLLTFSRSRPEAQAFIQDGRLVVRVPGKDAFHLDLTQTLLRGPHNEENIAAAVLAAACWGISTTVMQEVINRYRGLGHRVEWVGTWQGIDFFDDSKATNVGAVVKALENFQRPVLLLAGGRDKLGTYQPLADPVREKVKGLFLFGEAGPRIYGQLGQIVPSRLGNDLAGAFAAALAAAQAGDVVLLSPACSSFDQYASYAQRGDHFKRLVEGLHAAKEVAWRE